MGVIEQVSRYDAHVNAARMATMKHFVERAETDMRRLQLEGQVDARVNPAIAADALGAMVARFAELWLVQSYREYDFDEALEQLTLLWANALGMPDEQAAGTTSREPSGERPRRDHLGARRLPFDRPILARAARPGQGCCRRLLLDPRGVGSHDGRVPPSRARGVRADVRMAAAGVRRRLRRAFLAGRLRGAGRPVVAGRCRRRGAVSVRRLDEDARGGAGDAPSRAVRLRHARAAGDAPAASRSRRGELVPAPVGAERRIRPRQRDDVRRGGRRWMVGDGPEGVDVGGRQQRLRPARRPDRPRHAGPRRLDVLHHLDASARCRGPAAPADVRWVSLQRGLPRRGVRSGDRPDRWPRRRLGRVAHHADERTGGDRWRYECARRRPTRCARRGTRVEP